MNKKKNKKTKKKGGANPLFIKTIGYYTDKKLVDYRFLRNKIDKDTQKKYAKKHMVYYPMDPSSNKINDLFDISKEQKETVLNFLKPDPAMIFTDASSNQYYKDSESIVVHDKDHIKRIDITNKLINNLNTRTFDFSKNKKNVDCANLQECIEEYNLFISTNKAELMNGITADEITIIENELFGSPVFFYIIGKKLEFSNCEIDDLDLELVKTELDTKAGKKLLTQSLLSAATLNAISKGKTNALNAINKGKTNALNAMNAMQKNAQEIKKNAEDAISKLKQNKVGIESSSSSQPDIDKESVKLSVKAKPKSVIISTNKVAPDINNQPKKKNFFTNPFTKKNKVAIAGGKTIRRRSI
jgi:hypothetical protein